MRTGALLDLIPTNKEGLTGDAKVKGSLSCSDHEIVEFRVLRTKIKITTLYFRRVDFGLFRDLLEAVPWDKALEGREVQERRLILKGHLFQAEEQSIPTNSNSCKNATMPAWMNKELLAKLKKGVYRRWKEGQVT